MSEKINQTIKLIALGGIDELGKNMYLVEIDDDIFIIDAGLMFPENEMLGIDIVIPDITYLLANKERIRAILLTHGHEDHIGALSYVLKRIAVPVYGTRLTVALAKAKLKEQEFTGSAEFHEITSDSVLSFPTTEISFFKTNHSIPDSVGIVLQTSEGKIVHTGDFKFDQAATDLYKPEIGKMANIGDSGVLCLLSDSMGAEKPGYTTSETKVVDQMNHVFYNAHGRIIAACFASDINRIQHIFDAAHMTNRKLAVVGKSLQRVFDIALRLGYIKVPEDVIIPLADVKKYSDEQIVVLTTGTQGEPLEVLQKMAKQSHKYVNIQEGDPFCLLHHH